MSISNHFPRTVIEEVGIIRRVTEYLPKQEGNLLIISGEQSWGAVGAIIEEQFSSNGYDYHHFISKGFPTNARIKEVASIVKRQRISVILGIGGGRVCDLAKAVASDEGAFLITIPTIAATNAAFRKNAIIYDEHGGYVGGKQNRTSPDVVLVDAEVIGAAPHRYLAAGMVDSVSRSVDIRPYTIDESNNVLTFIYQNARLATDYLLRVSEKFAKRDVTDKELLQTIDCIISVVGVAGSKTKGRLYRAVTHPLHNEWTKLSRHHQLLHGEIIAFTTMVQLLLEGTDYHWYTQFLKNINFSFDISELELTTSEQINLLAENFVNNFTDEVSFFIHDLSVKKVEEAIAKAQVILKEEVFA